MLKRAFLNIETRKANVWCFIKLVSMPICYHKLLKLARTIADMADLKDIRQAHLLEAISYRQQDKRRH